MAILTKLDLAALRKADRVCFDHKESGPDAPEALRGTIRAIKAAPEATPRHPFPSEVTVPIAVESYVCDYAEGGFGPHVGFGMLHHPGMSAHWQTFLAFVRVGDDVHVQWTAANDNDYLRNAGLHSDTLDVVVKRGDRTHTFRMLASVCADNTARMVLQTRGRM